MHAKLAPIDAPSGPAAWGGRKLWAWLRRWAVPAFGVLVLGLLLLHARQVDWRGAEDALGAYAPGVLAAAFGIGLASHALYGCFDLLGRRHTGHRVPALRTWATAVASYAFNLNLGSLVGGIALRARLYARAGLDELTVAQVVGLSLSTNWLGYGLVAGVVFATGTLDPPREAHLDAASVQWLGAAMFVLVLGYVGLCAAAQGRCWQVRGRPLRLPGPGLAAMQPVLAAMHWALMGATLYLLLGQQIPYTTVLAVLLAASVVGVLMPIPGGLGVLEAVVLTLLDGDLPQGRLLGAVMAYRAVYYLVPLAIGALVYLALERQSAAVPEAADA